MAVKRRFQPLMRQLLIDSWHGRHIVTLGREAFLWFAIDQPREARQRLEAFWQREDRFTANLDIDLQDAQGHARTFTLHPLPHLTAEPDCSNASPRCWKRACASSTLVADLIGELPGLPQRRCPGWCRRWLPAPPR